MATDGDAATRGRLDRRAFLAVGALSTTGLALAHGASRAGAADPDAEVWRLSSDWGYPVGPKGKTSCSCRACHRRADSAYFTSEAAALAGRIHVCCVCQPYRTTVAGVDPADLFAGDDSADSRDVRVAAVLTAAGVPVGTPSAEPARTPGSSPAGAPAAARRDALATTGTDGRRLAGVGAALVALGGAFVAFRERQAPPRRAAVTASGRPRRGDDGGSDVPAPRR